MIHLQTKVTYKGHAFTVVADSAGLDVWAGDDYTEDIMKLAGELWHKIFSVRCVLFDDAEDHDTTGHELARVLDTLKTCKVIL